LNNSKLTNVGPEYRSPSFQFQDNSMKDNELENNANNKYDIGPYLPMANRPMGKRVKQDKPDKNKKKPSSSKALTNYVVDFDDLGKAIKSNAAEFTSGPLNAVQKGDSLMPGGTSGQALPQMI